MNTEDYRIISRDQQEMMKDVCAREMYHLGTTLDESDAEAMLNALADKYSGLYLKVLSQRYVKNLSTLEAMDAFMKNWSKSKYKEA